MDGHAERQFRLGHIKIGVHVYQRKSEQERFQSISCKIVCVFIIQNVWN